MRPDAIGPRDISEPYRSNETVNQELNWSKIDDLSLVPADVSLPKDGVNKQTATETSAIVFALLSAIRRE